MISDFSTDFFIEFNLKVEATCLSAWSIDISKGANQKTFNVNL